MLKLTGLLILIAALAGCAGTSSPAVPRPLPTVAHPTPAPTGPGWPPSA